MLVLASASPRRQELLRNAGIPFVVQSSNVAELPKEGENPRARAVFRQRPNDFILGADTIAIVDGQILCKPQDSADATRMRHLLSGRTHEVTTGVCLLAPQANARLGTASRELRTGFEDTCSETTLVTMNALSDDEIRSYVATGEPMDKAGAYAIQGIASRWISRVEGDYFNVVGLPVALVYRMLRKRGVL